MEIRNGNVILICILPSATPTSTLTSPPTCGLMARIPIWPTTTSSTWPPPRWCCRAPPCPSWDISAGSSAVGGPYWLAARYTGKAHSSWLLNYNNDLTPQRWLHAHLLHHQVLVPAGRGQPRGSRPRLLLHLRHSHRGRPVLVPTEQERICRQFRPQWVWVW